MAGALLSDELWDEIEHQFPEYEPSPWGGRPPVANRTALVAILLVLKTGIAWENLPQELGCSWRTCPRRLQEWNQQGVWRRVHAHLLARLHGAGRINWSRSLARFQFGQGPAGRRKCGPNPANRGRSVSKHHEITDAVGVTLAVTFTAAKTRDLQGALSTIIEVPPEKGRRGRPRTRPRALVADKAYDSDALRVLLKWLGIHPDIPKRGDDSRGLGAKRWPIERSIAWLHQFRRLRIRWERKLDNLMAFLQLGAAVV